MDGSTGVRGGMLAAARGFWLGLVAMTAGIVLGSLLLISLALVPAAGIGLLTTPYAVLALRAYANKRRELNAAWAGIPVGSAYHRLPTEPGLSGHFKRFLTLVRDPSTWRDLLWVHADGTAGAVLAVIPLGMIAQGIFGVLLPWLWDPLTSGGTGDTHWYLFVPVDSFPTAVIAAGLGVLLIAAGPLLARPLMGVHGRLTHTLLKPPPKDALTRRVSELYETRHDAVGSSAAELRRIERDLHDGAQARLVAMGMSLGTIEALIESDPATAKKLISQARENSAEALTELRDLVRGIHPPVLAERGLGDAVRALALRMPLTVETDVRLPDRFEEPVESAAYFAVSEVLTNAAKHSGADRVWLDVHYERDALRIAITDSGRGGADPAGGTGITGVERRLGPFDGVLAVSSPPGGPTMVTMEIPCRPVRP
ncbi:sensor domain-containing protein [Streptomyces sp. P38-E01]|uniref:histidine kinase n=1 Tax=Streptomyces tardus TaxID=2780544 RepID=A0A949JIB6_9ACTN|nr:sensor histidine kinase [Streptomyces tardus]MBU7599398.1 sensor domain-containing protein [Streptomyces tardus]